MARREVRLLALVSGTLLLLVPVPVRGFEQLQKGRSEPFNRTADEDDDLDYDDYTDEFSEEDQGFAVSEDGLQEAEDSNITFFDDKGEIFRGVEGAAVLEDDVLLEAEDDHDDDDDDDDDDDAADYDSYDDETEEAKGETSESSGPFGVQQGGAVSERLDSIDGEYAVLFVDTRPRSWTGCTTAGLDGLVVACTTEGFRITFPPGLLTEVQVLGSTNTSAQQAPAPCGYRVDHLQNTLTVPFSGCQVKEDEDVYVLHLFIDTSSPAEAFDALCVESSKFLSGQFPRLSTKDPDCRKGSRSPPAKPPKCFHQSTAPAMPFRASNAKSRGSPQRSSAAPQRSLLSAAPVTPATPAAPATPVTPVTPATPAAPATPVAPLHCAVDVQERIPCGPPGTSASVCRGRGCCVGGSKPSCYYPLDECTADQHFVFAIRQHGAALPVEPRNLFFPGKPLCKPTIVNDGVAVFKVKFTDCGAHSYDVGDMKIYLIEVHTAVRPLTLNYGVVTRSDPLRFLVECRFRKHGGAHRPVTGAGLMVQTTLSPPAVSGGLHAVQLRMSKDHTYSSFFSSSHQPLRLLLGRPVYLELTLQAPPHPDVVMLLDYCLAYPRSATNAMVLLYERCSDPDDPTVSILRVEDFLDRRHQRRLVVDAFRSMTLKTDAYLDEEIHFMCSTDVCDPKDGTCEERCFDAEMNLKARKRVNERSSSLKETFPPVGNK